MKIADLQTHYTSQRGIVNGLGLAPQSSGVEGIKEWTDYRALGGRSTLSCKLKTYPKSVLLNDYVYLIAHW